MLALLGGLEKPVVQISDMWPLYEEHRDGQLRAYSMRQYIKHKTSRLCAIAYLEALLGDIPLADIKRDDVMRFRDWWARKIAAEGLTVEASNHSFSDIKGMLTAIDDRLHTEYNAVWRAARIQATAATRTKERPPFPADFIQHRLLAPGALDDLDPVARLVFYLLIETGLRPSEACNLRPEDIRLDAEIPHIAVQEREDRLQKTYTSIREVPLVGVSLWALRQAPQGFPRYHDHSESFCAITNRTLKEIGLRPSSRHSVYSTRHSFQDRILAANAPDRLQADLMGHAFARPKYGEGSTLDQKVKLLRSIAFRWEP